MDLSLKILSPQNTISSKDIVTDVACNSAQVNRIDIQSPSRAIHRTPGVNVDVSIPSRGSNSSFAKLSRNIKPLDTYVDVSATQERNSDFSCIEKVGVKSLPDEIVAHLDPNIQVNLENSIISESPKFINLGLLTFDATGKPNIAFSPSTRAKYLNGMRREKSKADLLASRHDFERVSETRAYSNHINNSELETRQVFEQGTENIPLTRQMDLVAPLHENPLTRSTDSSKNEERHKPEVNPDPEPSSSDSSSKTFSSDSRTKKKKRNKKENRRKYQKYESSDPSLSNDSDSSDDSDYRRKRRKKKKHQEKDPIKLCASLT